jgi:hypothetical protein
MKKQMLTLMLLFSSGCYLMAQEKDTTRQKEVIIIIKSRNKINSNGKDTIIIKNVGKRKIERLSDEIVIDYGFNNYLQNGNFPEGNADYRLRNTPKYLALSAIKQIHIGGDKSPLFLNTGLELSWYGFMFDNDVRMLNNQGAVNQTVTSKFDDDGNPLNLRKSKFGIAYLSIPVMLKLDFDEAHQGDFKVGFGGYAGLRLKSWNKLKYDDGKKERNVDSYNLSDFRYGLMGEIGYDWFTLFVKYDLNPLFQMGKGFNPNEELNALCIGLRL